MDIYDEVAKLKGEELTDMDIAELDERAVYAKRWLKEYADDKFIFTLQAEIPTLPITPEQKAALEALGEKISTTDAYDGEVLHKLIHEVKEESGLSPKEFFGAIYTVFLGKDSGPKVGWFLSSLKKDFVMERLRGEG